jgi:hypothetical protein
MVEPFLSGMIKKDGARAICSYCEEEEKTLLDQIADSVHSILVDLYCPRDNYDDTVAPEGEPLLKVINKLTEMPDEGFAEDVRSLLADRHAAEWRESPDSDNPFGPNVHYAKNSAVDTWDLERDWYRGSRKTIG